MKRFYHGHQLLVYMYTFIYVDPDTMPEKEYLPYIKTFVENYKKTSTPGSVPKHQLGLRYIRSEKYALDMNFDKTIMKRKSENLPKNKDK